MNSNNESDRLKLFQLISKIRKGEKNTITIDHSTSAFRKIADATVLRNKKGAFTVRFIIENNGRREFFEKQNLTLMQAYNFLNKVKIYHDSALIPLYFEDVTDKGR